MQGIKKRIFSLITNKSLDYDDISSNASNNVLGFIVDPLKCISNNSLVQGVFLDEMKIARFMPIFKVGDKENVVNCRPIFILLYFSKILERIMYNRVSLYLTENDLLYNKQFGFQTGHSTDHTIVQLVDQIHDIFNKNI